MPSGTRSTNTSSSEPDAPARRSGVRCQFHEMAFGPLCRKRDVESGRRTADFLWWGLVGEGPRMTRSKPSGSLDGPYRDAVEGKQASDAVEGKCGPGLGLSVVACCNEWNR